MLNAKGIFSLSPFALMFIPLLTISLHIHINPSYTTHSYVNDMTCWNNLDINEFQPKGNNDMMQFVTCNKSSLFAPRLKALCKFKRKQIFLENKTKFRMFLKWKTLIHSYMKLRHESHSNATWIKVRFNSIQFNSNSI